MSRVSFLLSYAIAVLTITLTATEGNNAKLLTFDVYLDCVNHFCPPGTFCDERIGPCKKDPCRPILVCLPDKFNGCSRHSCPSGEICVERTRPCISRSCKKIPSCTKPGTCDALVCPPSQKCILSPTPTCVKHIPTTGNIIGKATLVRDE
uniref:TIL domain-containing protein n=1 Tax=Heterorhabditis bacteriophora TaxID=37862 RepID=A0A1I7W9M7_HETBA